MISEKVSHCLIFGFAWTAWVSSVISLASYNWIAENVGSINGPYTYGLYMERDTCSLCQPLLNPPDFVLATRGLMIAGCVFGFLCCLLDVLVTLVFSKKHYILIVCVFEKCFCVSLVRCCDDLFPLRKYLKYASAIGASLAALFTLIGVAIFQTNGVYLLDRNGVDGTLLQPYGYGLVLAWLSWVLYFFAVPFAFIEACRQTLIITDLAHRIRPYIEAYLKKTENSTNREIGLIREVLKKMRNFIDHPSTSSESTLLIDMLYQIRNFLVNSPVNKPDLDSKLAKDLVNQIRPEIAGYLNNTINSTRQEIMLMRKILELVRDFDPSTSSSESTLLEEILDQILDYLQSWATSAPNPSPTVGSPHESTDV